VSEGFRLQQSHDLFEISLGFAPDERPLALPVGICYLKGRLDLVMELYAFSLFRLSLAHDQKRDKSALIWARSALKHAPILKTKRPSRSPLHKEITALLPFGHFCVCKPSASPTALAILLIPLLKLDSW
jgi:hypothetical protein